MRDRMWRRRKEVGVGGRGCTPAQAGQSPVERNWVVRCLLGGKRKEKRPPVG